MLLAGIDNIDSWHDTIGFLKQETTCFFAKTGASEIPRTIVSAAQVFHIVGLKDMKLPSTLSHSQGPVAGLNTVFSK